MTTNYTEDDLQKLHLQSFHTVADPHPRGKIVGRTWFLRISNDHAILVTPYSVKQEDGTWKEEEHTLVL